MNTINIKKGDTAVVISGKEKGKQAKVLRVEPGEEQSSSRRHEYAKA